jgi:leucyl-tRNA synthetase
VGDYVLAGYGTGAVMAVPGGDQRDWRFAKHFGLPIIAVTEGADIEKGADERKDATICSEGFLKGLKVPQAITRAIQELEKLGAGEGKINFRLRDAAFGRQRYWGEPIPIYYKDGIPIALPESALPLELPAIDKFQPTETGEPPLARAERWAWDEANKQISGSGIGFPIETTTMPGWAGSSWYFLRYMDPHNAERFASPEAVAYWNQIDLYVGGSEHATGHLLYFRFWTKFLYDRGWIPFDEPAKKLVNQGMIQGVSALTLSVTRAAFKPGWDGFDFPRIFVSSERGKSFTVDDLRQEVLVHNKNDERVPEFTSFQLSGLNAPIEFLENHDKLDQEKFLAWRKPMEGVFSIRLVKECDGSFLCLREPEKMSKSKFNVVNPDDIIAKYGADTLRLYEMFLGPLEQSKPWDTNGIEGTYRFLRKFWNLFHASAEASAKADGAGNAFRVSDDAPTKPELKILHATLKKVTEDIEKMSFNTSVAQFMIAVNELGSLKCNKRAVLEPLVIALAPFAPHIAEELWEKLGHTESVTTAVWPVWDAQHLVEDSFSYPISFNGKTRLQLEFPIGLSKEEVEAQVLANPEVQARLEGKAPKKVIVVPKRIVNIVV